MKRAALFGSLALVLLACGPNVPPKQANAPDPPDPTEESAGPSDSSGASSASASSSSGQGDVLASPSSGAPVAKAAKGEPGNVSSLAHLMDGLRWGMSHAEVTKLFTQTNGVIWKDYDEKLKKARVGPEQTALEAERERAKQAFGRSYLEFKDTPTGYDTTGIRSEYTYRNKESLMWIERQGRKRYFFFINDRLWKLYDEVPLAEGGPLGKSYAEAVSSLNGKLGAHGRAQAADPAKGVDAPTTDWKDGSSHLRAVDRSGESIVALAVEDSATLGNLASLRANKPVDPTAIDPSVSAVTKGENRTDPNATATPAKPAKKK